MTIAREFEFEDFLEKGNGNHEQQHHQSNGKNDPNRPDLLYNLKQPISTLQRIGQLSIQDFINNLFGAWYQTFEPFSIKLTDRVFLFSLLIAFLAGGYELGPRGATNAVPEPTSVWLLLSGALFLASRRRSARLGGAH